MEPARRRRILVLTTILLVVAALAGVALLQRGTKVRTRWELARVRAVEKPSVVYLADKTLRDDKEGGWTVGVLRPTHPIWRYEQLALRLLPGAEVVLPSGERMVVAGSADSTQATAFRDRATRAMTVDAAVTQGGSVLVARRVVVGKPAYLSVADTLRGGFDSADAPRTAAYDVSGRAAFQRLDGRELLVLTLPIRQDEESVSATERQYALVLPDTLYLARDDSGVRQITAAEAKRLIAEDPTELVQADLEQRGEAMVVVQLRVRGTQQ